MSEPLPLLWCDIETTGLDREADCLLEIACFTSDPLGTIVSSIETWTIQWHQLMEFRLQQNPFVFDMHTENGLIGDCVDSELTLEDFEFEFTAYIHAQLGYYNTSQLTMAGSGVGPFDLPFMLRKFKWLEKRLTYYVMDVGVIGRFVRNVLQVDIPDREAGNHRAADDISDHYKEFTQYKKILSR